MYIQLIRDPSTDLSTHGEMYVNGTFECYTLEDPIRDKKIAGITAIPSGTYEIKLRNVGGMTKKYSKKYTNHEGMLWLQDVPNFQWVYIHTGNIPAHTEGCILVGTLKGADSVGHSVDAYKALYKKAIAAFHRNEDVTIEIIQG